tara:strand:- start:100494 stop:101081 length:588 start_codon:yes stop_codon:yes gene_type:complete
MKTIITTIILLLSIGINAQNTYLKIHKDDTLENTISYPPGTEFELRNEHNYIILKDNKTPRIFEIDGNYKLIVFPSYKTEKDVYELTKGAKVELRLTKKFEKPANENIFYIDENSLKSEKKVTDSTIKKGKKNLVFKMSNGIKFQYTDGTYFATYYDEYIDVVGKYVIKTKTGTLKLSFNPNNGETWWVFQKVQK